MTFNKYPPIHFKLNKELDITTLHDQNFYIERKYHSGGVQMVDIIHCPILGIPKPQATIERRKIPEPTKQHTTC